MNAASLKMYKLGDIYQTLAFNEAFFTENQAEISNTLVYEALNNV